MKNLLTTILFILVLGAVQSFAQTVEIGIEDLRQLRKAVVDGDYQKKRADELETERDAWKRQSESWRGLYESERSRADDTQGGRITELQKQVDNLNAANFQYKAQAEADRVKLGELEFRVRKYKGQRKWFFAAGIGLGAVAGVGGAYRVGRSFNF